MKSNKRIFVYTEASPVHANVVAHGMNRAGVPVLKSIMDYIAGIGIFPVGRRFEGSDLDPELAPLCVTLPRLPALLCKALRRYPMLDLGISRALPPLMLAPAARRSSSDILLSFVGVDMDHLERAARLAARMRKPYAVYVVDDFIAVLRGTGVSKRVIQQATERAGVLLRGATHVFTITEGLGESFREAYGVSPIELSLAFEPAQRPVVPVKKQIIYVGSVNFLYAEGLHHLFKAVEQLRNAGAADLTVRLTVDAAVAARELGALPPFVISAPVETAEGLAAEIASSLFAFLPYSFDQRHKGMVSTSFPSKSLEYLAYARSIVVYGPEYGVATQYFRKAALPAVVSSPEELLEATRTHLALQPDHSVRYKEYLVSSHSVAAIRSTLCKQLGLEGTQESSGV